MCVIVYKPAGRSLPSRETLLNCFRTNSDGCGFMYPLIEKNKVMTKKGFMSFDSLMKALENVQNIQDIPMVIHFRIGTQGKNDRANTHPFPISSSKETLTALTAISDVSLTHNGIIPLTSAYGYRGDDHSDTFHFVKDYASLICNGIGWYEDNDKHVLLEKLAESKLCIMDGDGEVSMIGTFIHDTEDFCYYSNSSYMGWSGYGVVINRGSASRDAWGWTDDDYYDGVTGSTISDEEWAHYEKTGKWLDQNDTVHETVTAAFVGTGLWVVNESSNIIIDSNADLFVYDRIGRVYAYNDDNATIRELRGYSVVNDNMDIQFAKIDECVLFAKEEDQLALPY